MFNSKSQKQLVDRQLNRMQTDKVQFVDKDSSIFIITKCKYSYKAGCVFYINCIEQKFLLNIKTESIYLIGLLVNM